MIDKKLLIFPVIQRILFSSKCQFEGRTFTDKIFNGINTSANSLGMIFKILKEHINELVQELKDDLQIENFRM